VRPIPEARDAPRRLAAAIANEKERISWILSADGIKASIAIKCVAQHRDRARYFSMMAWKSASMAESHDLVTLADFILQPIAEYKRLNGR
jgi:hypothetical protein